MCPPQVHYVCLYPFLSSDLCLWIAVLFKFEWSYTIDGKWWYNIPLGPDNGHFNVGLGINPIERLKFVMLTENSLNAIDV